jgi:LemA protein
MEILIVLGIIVAIAFWAIAIYNNLVNLRNRVRNGFAQIDVQLTRRYDLIPNLIEAVKGYMSHERETLTAVIEARNSAVAGLKQAATDPANAEAIQALGAAEVTLGGTLGRLFALVENYPDLKASENMMQLEEDLQRCRHVLQQRLRELPKQPRRKRLQFQARGVSRNHGQAKARSAERILQPVTIPPV